MKKGGCENEKAKLKAGFESAASCAEMYEAMANMVNSGLFGKDELGPESLKISHKLFEEGHDPQNFLFMISSGGTTGKEAELKRAFYAAKSGDEMVRAFQNMEQHVKEEYLGMEYSVLVETLFDEASDWEKVILYGERALKYYIGCEDITGCNKTALMVANLTSMLGSACRELGRYNESLSYLNWSLVNLNKLESDNSVPDEFVLENLIDAHKELSLLKTSMGRLDEAYHHLETIGKIQQKMVPQDSVENGMANNALVYRCLGEGKLKEAFPLVLKTVEIYDAKHLANDPEKLALLNKSLGIMYCGMKEYGKAMEIGSSESGLKLLEEVESANELLVFGKFEDGEAAMKAVISQGIGFTTASASVALARALCNKEKFGVAKEYLKNAQRIVESKQINPMVLADVMDKSTKTYEEIEEIEAKKSYDQNILKMMEAFGFNADGTIDGVVKIMMDRHKTGSGDSR